MLTAETRTEPHAPSATDAPRQEAPAIPDMDEVRRSLDQLNDRFVAFARNNPGTCLLGALAVGFVVGKIAARY